MAAYRRVYDYACMSLWTWFEVVAAHHRVHDYACCHLQADRHVWDQLHSQTLHLQIWDLPLPYVHDNIISVQQCFIESSETVCAALFMLDVFWWIPVKLEMPST